MCKIVTTGLVGLAPRRKRAGFSQYSFAEELGIDRGLVAMYETGRAWPPASRLPAMADLLGCSIDELYEVPADVERSDPPPAAPEPPFARGARGDGESVTQEEAAVHGA